MKKGLKFIFMTLMVALFSVSFTSCSCDEDDDYGNYGSKNVDSREYKSYIIGKWVLTSEDGYADFNRDGLNEIFSADIVGGNEIGNSGEYKTCLYFRDFENVDIIPYNTRKGTYEDGKPEKCRYTLNYNIRDGETYIHIYNGKDINNHYIVTLFKERWLDLKLYGEGQMVTFHFEYVY